MKKLSGVAEMIMLALVFFTAVISMYLAHQFDVTTKKAQADYVERQVIAEALMIENYSRALEEWFNLKGKGLIYACESTTPDCKLNSYQNILPTHYSDLLNDSFIPNNSVAKTLGSDGSMALSAAVVKKPDVPSGYDYEIVLSFANLTDN